MCVPDAKQNSRLQHLKDEYVRSEGYWSADLEHVLNVSPDFFAAYAGLVAVPAKSGRLAPKIRELISIGINAAVTHLHAPAIKIHIANALRHGATAQEIAEVCQLAAVLGTHTMSFGVPILIDEMRKAGRLEELHLGELTAAQQAMKAEFISKRGYWKEHNEAILKLSPEYFTAYKNYSSHPWLTGTLEPKVREFIYIAIDVSTTHLYELGTRVHLQNALGYGATAGEILDVFLVTSLLGLQTNTVMLPLLIEELSSSAKSG
jgi:alkylhydroperoxidase/carboxymuconolactone decarboxylase family protein YurZ